MRAQGFQKLLYLLCCLFTLIYYCCLGVIPSILFHLYLFFKQTKSPTFSIWSPQKLSTLLLQCQHHQNRCRFFHNQTNFVHQQQPSLGLDAFSKPVYSENFVHFCSYHLAASVTNSFSCFTDADQVRANIFMHFIIKQSVFTRRVWEWKLRPWRGEVLS